MYYILIALLIPLKKKIKISFRVPSLKIFRANLQASAATLKSLKGEEVLISER